jgi:phage terminase small subunit
MGKLNDRQEKFCIEYIKNGGNATTAYKAAGYMNTAAAHVNAGALMQKPEIKARIAELLGQQRADDIADANEILRYLTSVMRGNHKTGQLVVVGTGQGYSAAEIFEKDPDEKERIEAAKTLAKIHGLFTTKIDLNGDMLVQIVDDIPEDGDGE